MSDSEEQEESEEEYMDYDVHEWLEEAIQDNDLDSFKRALGITLFSDDVNVCRIEQADFALDLAENAGKNAFIKAVIMHIRGKPWRWEAAEGHPAAEKILKRDRARKNWAKTRKKIKTLSIYWYWVEQVARRLHATPDPEAIAFMVGSGLLSQPN